MLSPMYYVTVLGFIAIVALSGFLDPIDFIAILGFYIATLFGFTKILDLREAADERRRIAALYPHLDYYSAQVTYNHERRIKEEIESEQAKWRPNRFDAGRCQASRLANWIADLSWEDCRVLGISSPKVWKQHSEIAKRGLLEGFGGIQYREWSERRGQFNYIRGEWRLGNPHSLEEWARTDEMLSVLDRIQNQQDSRPNRFDRIASEQFLKAESERLRAIELQKALGGKTLEQLDKMKGVQFEGWISEVLGARGWKVQSTPANGDYGADLIAEKGGKRIAIQAKRYTKPVGNRAVTEALGGQSYYKCTGAAVITQSSFTKHAREQAEAAGTILIGRQALGDMDSLLTA